jgi:hypothetical protein
VKAAIIKMISLTHGKMSSKKQNGGDKTIAAIVCRVQLIVDIHLLEVVIMHLLWMKENFIAT